MRRWMCILLLGVTGLSWSGPSQAQVETDSRAREFWENGVILYEEGRYEDAIVAWKEGYRLSQRPLFLFNIANAQERVGLWREALDTLNLYRAHATPDEREALDRRIANLERRLASQPAPLPPAPVERVPEPTSSAPSGRSLLWPLTLSGVGVGGLTLGLVSGTRALGARSEASELCSAGTQLCPSTAADVLQRDRRSALVADLGIVLGTAALGGGVVLALRPGDETSVLGLSPQGVSWSGRF